MTLFGGVTLFVTACILLTSECYAQAPRFVIVRTPLGDLRGRVSLVFNETVVQFLGVPYAEPPLGQRRFRKPVPVRAWSSVLDATLFGPSCPQPEWGRAGFTREDCLYLNVYVKANSSFGFSGLKPVMVWIHGGGFVSGSGRGVDGSVMAVRGDVVVVTLNYRLGLLGWLSTLDDASPGNYGLWDQMTALEWVRDNIAVLGGDPSQVTIFGESGGGYSVGLHSLSPLNNGLFHRAIMQSGSALNRRTIALDPVGFAQRFGRHVQCWRPTSRGFDTHFLIECARQRSVNDILRATETAAVRSTLAWILDVAPVVDGELIPADVETLLGPQYHDQVPFWNLDIMVGTTSAEGSLVLTPLLPFQGTLNFTIADGIPTGVLRHNITTALARDYFNGSRNVSDALFREYGSQRGEANQARQVVNLYGDMMFVSAAVETLQRHANVTGDRRSHYQYLFSHTRADRAPYPWFRGAGHAAEVGFVFGMPSNTPNEARLSLAMLQGWTNFAKFGTPNHPQPSDSFFWPAYDLTTKAYTDLDLPLTVQHDLYSRRMRFWLQTIPGLYSEVSPLPSVTQTSGNNFDPPVRDLKGSQTLEAGNSAHSSTLEEALGLESGESTRSSISEGASLENVKVHSVLKLGVPFLVSLFLM